MTATALVVTHLEQESVGALGEWLPQAGLALHEVRPWQGEPLPESLDDFAAVVVLGGPQQAYDDRSAPWLRPTKALLSRAVQADLAVLGICLGAQLLAEAVGGRVAPGDEGPEIGARLVAKRDAAWDDDVFRDVALTPTVVQWHEDAIVQLPPGAVHLASSTRYAHQAFRVGRAAYGLQFHVEATPELVEFWVREALPPGADADVVRERTLAELDEVAQTWRPAVERFAELALRQRPRPLPLLDS